MSLQIRGLEVANFQQKDCTIGDIKKKKKCQSLKHAVIDFWKKFISQVGNNFYE